MNVEAQVNISAARAAVWAAIIDIENGAQTISGIEAIEMVEKPAHGLLGMRWRETRMLFGQPATAEKWITDAADGEFYTTRADDGGFTYLCTKRVSDSPGGCTLSETHQSIAQSALKKLVLIPMGFLFKGVARKAVLQDLNDIKLAVERAELVRARAGAAAG